MIQPQNVHETLAKYQLADGYPFVLDLEKSHGAWLHDARTGKEYLDFFTCFASWPVGYNHPRLAEPDFLHEMQIASTANPANSDLYTTSMTAFVEAFATRVTPQGFPHHFWIAGGALAVENALKVAFDWKAQKIGATDDGASLAALHFRQAFHGRSGYTMSLTNTDPTKVANFPKFCWPRVHNPAIEFGLDGGIANDIEAEEAKARAEIDKAFEVYGDKIACIVLEPMQGEGGDNHFRPEFFLHLRKIADEREALLCYDEVQTGFWGSGAPWLWQKKGVAPDVVAFGKKTQVCGIYASPRVEEVPEHVFKKSSRINSTWGGNLADMVRCRQFISIVEEDDLGPKIEATGQAFVKGLRDLAQAKGCFTNVRGEGTLIAFTLESPEVRDRMLEDLMKNGLLALASGERAIRFRLPFVTGDRELEAAFEKIEASLPSGVGA